MIALSISPSFDPTERFKILEPQIPQINNFM